MLIKIFLSSTAYIPETLPTGVEIIKPPDSALPLNAPALLVIADCALEIKDSAEPENLIEKLHFAMLDLLFSVCKLPVAIIKISGTNLYTACFVKVARL